MSLTDHGSIVKVQFFCKKSNLFADCTKLTFKEQKKWGKHIFHKMPDAVAVCNSVIGNVQEICLQARKAEHINTINEACYGGMNTTWFP